MARPTSLDYEKYTKELFEELYLAQNLSRKEIGEKLKMSSDRVKTIVNHWGLAKTKEQILECQHKNIAKKANTGWYKKATAKSWQDPEIRKKRLEGQKRSLTPERRKQLSLNRKGKKAPESQRQKMRKLWKQGKWDFFRSEEYWANKRENWSERSKKQFAGLNEEEKERRRKFIGNLQKDEKYRKKRIETMRKNKSWSRSNLEQRFHDRMLKIFPNTIREYRSEKYPYNCDFFIPDLGLYIELNLHWTHGKKPYLGTEEDKKKVEFWKSKHTKYYDNAIYVWTDLDVRKRNTAKENGLYWVEFFFWEECDFFLTTLENSLLI